jgi:hypothetical protein
MLVKNITLTNGLTIDKMYPVIRIDIDSMGNRSFDIINDFSIDEKLNTAQNFVSVSYPAEIFEVVEESLPSEWVTRQKRIFFFRKITSITYPFFFESQSFFARMVDGSEPERSYFFHKLQELYDHYHLGKLIPKFTVIPKSHLINVKWPNDVLEDWTDPIDGSIYKAENSQ